MARFAARRPGREGEPSWVGDLDQASGDAVTVFARTYSAIASAGTPPVRPPRRARPRLVTWSVPIVAVLLAGLAIVSALRPRMLPWRDEAADLVFRRQASRPSPPQVIGTSPARPKAALRVGESRDFAVVARGAGLRYGWTLDGVPAGTGPRWTYAPDRAQVGRRRVEVTVTDAEGAGRRSWAVRVRPARPPTILAAEPGRDSVTVTAGSPVHLRIEPRAATPAEHLDVRWTVDGKPAGRGSAIALRPERAGVVAVRAVVASDLGGRAVRDWRLTVAEPEPAPEPAPENAAPRAPPPRAPRAPATQAHREPPPSRDDDVRRWLDRYAAAWRARDVDLLRRMGQVTTDDEVDALRRYFAGVRDLDVELNLLGIYSQAGRTVVRFTRRDRFRDPAGRLVLKESPPIEKQIVRTSDGFRIERPRG